MPLNKTPAFAASLLLLSALSVATAADALPEESTSVIPFIVFGIFTIVVAGLLLTGLTQWSRRQDEINNMMYFCMDFLVNTTNTVERYRAAKELGKTKSPEALLVLVEVVNDASAEESIRDAARDALLDMSEKYRSYRKVIAGLLAASEVEDHERTIELLKEHFEIEDRKYVQSAYVIGRKLIELKEYADAREWLRIADHRNRKFPMYVDQINDLIDSCSRHLFAEGDMAFKAGDFHQANERYALAAQGLSTEVTNRFAYYLRAASVYCKLGQHESANQALLQGLHHQNETDTALELNRLVSNLLNLVSDGPQAEEERRNLATELDEFVNQTMDKLTVRDLED